MPARSAKRSRRKRGRRASVVKGVSRKEVTPKKINLEEVSRKEVSSKGFGLKEFSPRARSWCLLTFAEELRRKELLQRLFDIDEQRRTLSTLKHLKYKAVEKELLGEGEDSESLLAEEVEKTRTEVNTASLPGRRFYTADLHEEDSPIFSTSDTIRAVSSYSKIEAEVPPLVSTKDRKRKAPRERSSRRSRTGKSAPKNRQSSYCLRIVKEFLRLKDSHGFAKPIEEIWARDQLPGYFEMIERPMDLRTIRNNLNSGVYFKKTDKEATPGEQRNTASESDMTFDALKYAEDMRMVFTNAMKYNKPGDVYYEAAVRLSERFEKKFKQLPSATAPPTSVRPPKKKRKKTHPRKDTASIPKEEEKVSKPVTRAKSPEPESPVYSNLSREELEEKIYLIERGLRVGEKGGLEKLYATPMTFDDKVRLSQDVNLLGPEKLQKLIALVSKAVSSQMEVNEDEEVELDIEKLDNRTLRDMEAIVNANVYRKNGKVQGMTPEKAAEELVRLKAALGDMKGDEDELGESESASESRSDSESSDFESSDSDDEETAQKSPAPSEEVRRRRERNIAHMRQMAGVIASSPNPLTSTSTMPHIEKGSAAGRQSQSPGNASDM